MMSSFTNITKMLCQARQIGEVETLTRMLHREDWRQQLKLAKANSISLNSQDEDGETILIRVSRMNRLDVVKFLIEECKVDVNHQDSEGQKAFHVANSEEIQIYLLQHGTEVHPIMLHFAASDNHFLVVQAMIDMRFDVNFKNPQGDTALALCMSTNGSEEMITLLKNNGATI